MFRVGFISTPLRDGNSVRGVGFYTKNLLENLKIISEKSGIKIVENSEDCDLIHYPFFDLFRHTLPIFPKTKTVVTIHDVIPLEYPNIYKKGIRGWINLQLQKLALNNADKIITDSHASVKSIKKYLGIPDSKINLIYLAAGHDFVPRKVIKKYDLPKKFILYIGDVNWNKNIPNLIKACELINIPLVIIGKQATEISNLKSQISMNITNPQNLIREIFKKSHPQLKHLNDLETLINSKNVIRMGYVSDEEKIDILNLATVYCQPSLAEGFGLPVLEAMACGTQVAVSNTHSLPEIAGDTAEYFNPNNISEMAKAIKKSMTNKYNVISQSKKFSWEQTATQTLQVYNAILKS